MSYGQVKMRVKTMDRTEKEPRFRTLMYIMIGTLIVGYFGIKARHISMAIDAYQGQVLERDTAGAAK